MPLSTQREYEISSISENDPDEESSPRQHPKLNFNSAPKAE